MRSWNWPGLHALDQVAQPQFSAVTTLLTPVEQVPSVTAQTGVSQVHFRSDLAWCTPMTEAEAAEALTRLCEPPPSLTVE